MTVSAICAVNNQVLPVTGTTGLNVTAGSTVTITLANSSGVCSNSTAGWSIYCSQSDGLNPNSNYNLINETLSVNYTNFTATFTAPAMDGYYGAALQFTSIVNNGQSWNTDKKTFGIFVLNENGNRLVFNGENLESNATFGAVVDINKGLASDSAPAGGITSLIGEVTASGSGTVTATITPGTSGQVLMSNAIPATAWISITGDVIANPTGLFQVQSLQDGTIDISNNAGNMQWWNGATPQLSQVSVSTTSATNFIITPQVSTNSSNGTSGSLLVNLEAAAGSGNEAYFTINRSGTTPNAIFQVGYGSGTTSGCAALWMPSNGVSPTGSNPVLYTFAGRTYVNATSSIQLQVGATTLFTISNTIGINGTSTSLVWDATNTGPLYYQSAPTSDLATVATSLFAQSSFPTASANLTGGNLNLGAGDGYLTSGGGSGIGGSTNIIVGGGTSAFGAINYQIGQSSSVGTMFTMAPSGHTTTPTTMNFQCGNIMTAMTYKHTALASTSAGSGSVGSVTTIQAQAGQAATGASHNGGAGGQLILSSGVGGTSGSATAGTVGTLQLQVGGTTQASATPLGFSFASSTVTINTNGTTNLTAAQMATPVLIMSSATQTGLMTLNFGGAIGQFWVDFSAVTNSSDGLAFKNGTQTVVVTTLWTIKTLFLVSCETTNSINVG